MSQFKSGEFQMELKPGERSLALCISGRVDEGFDFTQAIQAIEKEPIKEQTLRFSMENVTRINSIGVRSWIIFLEKLGQKFRIEFDRICESFVEQACMITAVLGKRGNTVRAIEIPYGCHTCETREGKWVETMKIVQFMGGSDAVLPVVNCASCKKPMEMDVDPQEYFIFLDHCSAE